MNPPSLQHTCIILIHNNFVGCVEGGVRIVSGGTPLEGRVEICLDDEWGTVCDQMWNNADASVVCRQLGMSPTGAIQNCV